MTIDIKIYNIFDFAVPHGIGFIKVRRLEDVFLDAGLLLSPHRHDYYQIFWVKSGRGRHHIDLNTYRIEPDSLFFLAPGQIHTWDWTEKPFGYSIGLTENFFAFEQQDKQIMFDVLPFGGESSAPVLRIAETQSGIFDWLLQKIENEYLASFAGIVAWHRRC